MSNEITAYFKGRIGVAESVYQYDYGMVLVLDGIELPDTFDCYFSNEGDEEATPAIGADNRVAIPNKCLSVSGNVTVHIPLQEGLNDSEVEYIVTVKVINRARPVDNGTEEERSVISEAIAALNHNNLPGLVPDIVTEWLDEHPEATTTVQDHSLTEAKFTDELKLSSIKDYVTPQMYGAKGDGVTDDTEAILEAFTHKNVFIPSGTYLCSGTIKYLSGQTVRGENRETSIIYLLNNGNGFISNCTQPNTPAIVNFQMEDVTLKYNADNSRTDIPIRFNNSYRLHVRHCSFIASGTNHDYSIVDIHRDFTNYSSGNTWANRFEDCYFYKTRVYFNKNTDSWFINNDINCIGMEYALRLDTADGILCQGNQIIGSLQLGRNVGIEIVDNYFDGYYKHDDPARWDGITQNGILRNAIISRNRFYELPGMAINLSYATSGLQDVSICDNQFEYCDIFNDGVPDIHISNSSTPTLISGNKGNRYSYYTVDGTNAGARPATAPMLLVDSGVLNYVFNNIIHNGYTATDGTYIIPKNNYPKAQFAAHNFGNISSSNGITFHDAIGAVAFFQSGSAVITIGSEYIIGTSNRVKLKVSNGQLLIDKVYTSEGVEIQDISSFSVFVTSVR